MFRKPDLDAALARIKVLADGAYEQGYSDGESSALADVMAIVDGDYDDAEAIKRIKLLVGIEDDV